MRTRDTQEGYSLKPFVELGCLFIHLPKCAGVSVCKSLFGNLGGGHLTARNYECAFTPEEYAGMFKFTVVRNPWDRVSSAYHFLKRGGMGPQDRRWADQNLAPHDDLRGFVLEGLRAPTIQQHLHFRKQTDFLRSSDGRFRLDYLALLENLDNDFRAIGRRLERDVALPKANQTQKRDYRDAFDDDMRSAVAEVYREDIQQFGYEFDNSSLPQQIEWRDSWASP